MMSKDFNTEKATHALAQLPEGVRLAAAKLLLEQLADHERGTHPNTFDSSEQELRETLIFVVRESVKEGDAAALSVMTTWLLMHADKRTLTALSYFLEHDDEPEPTLSLVTEGQ